MTIPQVVYLPEYKLHTCELENCLHCGKVLEIRGFLQSSKIVQTLSETLYISHQIKQCKNPMCKGAGVVLRSSRWEQIAPRHISYGYDVIAQIGWWRQQEKQQFMQIHGRLASDVQISESNIRQLYYKNYLPLLACYERTAYPELEAVARSTGLILQTDGLAPEGGEAQLWFVRELQTGLTLRSGWMSKQDEAAFFNFLEPIAKLGLPIAAVLSDKQRGLLPAVERAFPDANHAYCQAHYLKGLAEPIADKDSEMKVKLRKMVRQEIGEVAREEEVEAPGVLTVTGLVASPIKDECTQPIDTNADTAVVEIDNAVETEVREKEYLVNQTMAKDNSTPDRADARNKAEETEKERQKIVQDIRRRVRFLLTLKGRPPFRLAGLEMYRGLQEVVVILGKMLAHHPDNTLMTINQALSRALVCFSTDFQLIYQAEQWLHQIDSILDPDLNPPRNGDTVKQELTQFLDNISIGQESWLDRVKEHLTKKTKNYASGLFHTYDNSNLPRTNNEIESAFRDVQRRLLSTTGQKGLTKRLLHRYGAWELLPCPDTLPKLVQALSDTSHKEWKEERQRFEQHQQRFQMHTRSPKRAKKQLDKLLEQWCSVE